MTEPSEKLPTDFKPKNNQVNRFLVWYILSIGAISACLCCLWIAYTLAHFNNLLADKLTAFEHERPQLQLIQGKQLGGFSGEEISQLAVQYIQKLQPDKILFIGNQLAKKDLVDCLYQHDAIAAVDIGIGYNVDGNNQLSRQECPLHGYHFRNLKTLNRVIVDQTLIVLNTKRKEGLVLIGGYPFDIQQADAFTHTSILSFNYQTAVDSYNQNSTLFN